MESENYIETRKTLHPQITTEAVDGLTIGRVIIPVRPFGGQVYRAGFDEITRRLNQEFESRERAAIVHRLNHNNLEGGPINMKRPVSAYFTHDPEAKEIIIEWGKINPDDQIAKLHTYLNRMINYRDRVKGGTAKLSSGHIGKLEGYPGYVALLDNLASKPQQLDPATNLGRFVNTLHSAGILPITPEGFAQPRAGRQMKCGQEIHVI